MDNNETNKNESEFVEKCWDKFCCGNPGDINGTKDDRAKAGPAGCCSMMGKCRWFPLMPVVLGIILLLLGYYLDASITRVLWMFAAGFIALLGLLGLILAGRMKGMCC